MAPTSKDGSRRGNCPLSREEAVTGRDGRAHGRRVREGDWRASSVPAAAVIPTPRVSTVDAAQRLWPVGCMDGEGWACVDEGVAGGGGYRRARDEMAKTLPGPTVAKAAPQHASVDQGRRPEDRK
jgi:hypothetical protein